MKKLIKLLLVVIVASVIAAAVASAISKKKLAGMSDDEIRAFLASKIGTKVGEDQLGSIQDAVIAGVRKTSGAPKDSDHSMGDGEDTGAELSDDPSDAVGEADEAGDDKGEDAEDEAKA